MTTRTAPDLAAPYWTLAHLSAVLPFDRTRIYELTREPDFPRPIQLSASSTPVW